MPKAVEDRQSSTSSRWLEQTYFIQKPYTPDALTTKIKKALAPH